MRLKTLELNGFKSFAQKTVLEFDDSIVCIVGPNGSGKSNVVEAIRYVLGEQSMKSIRGKSGSDLIFKGSKNLPKSSRASASIYFDNSDKIFKLENDGGENINLNYDTISISREVFSDGLNKYILNGTEIRLRDIHNLLASVNIGSSGHHIISQGEADRILNANAEDRREMVEDALGLKIYQFKIKESEKKLEKTKGNMKEVELLRRENAPHLNFLKKQMEKFEKAKEMQAELATLYREYLKKEDVFLEKEKFTLLSERNKIKKELGNINLKISITEDDDPLRHSDTSPLSRGRKGGGSIEELKIVEDNLNKIRVSKSETERKLGRIEGMIEAKQNRVRISGKCPTCGRELVEMSKEQIESRENGEKELVALKNSQADILAEMREMENKEKDFLGQTEKLKQAINQEMKALRDLEKEKFKFKVRYQELTSSLELVNIKEESLKERAETFENEIKEGVALIGQEILSYKNYNLKESIDLKENRTQEELKHKIERIKIKLEDAGVGGGAEIVKEFKEVSERDQFLMKEMEDLAKSLESLQKLITELKEKINLEFKEGVKKINVEFQNFFTLLFGGGTGSLAIFTPEKRKKKILDEESGEEIDTEEDEEVEPKQGIEINVSLPHKKVKELQALSGGERSLTSIALLFAMSQVNPPPFLVLDETDAALDEANSRKYGDMLEKLSKRSQLIVVTHNRETMSRAGVLYGVTIGSNGASKLLSVKFEEATQIAK